LRTRIATCLSLIGVLAAPALTSPPAAEAFPASARSIAGEPAAVGGVAAAKLPWKSGGARVVPGRLVVVYRSGASTASARALTTRMGATTTSHAAANIDVVQLPPGASETAAIRRYERSPLVRSAEPDRIASVMAVPDDTLFSQQWALDNTHQQHELTDQGLGAGKKRRGTTDADVDAPEAWDAQTVHDPVVVAVIDTGVDINHADLQNALWTNTAEQGGLPGVDDDGNGRVDDLNGWDFYGNDADPTPSGGIGNSHGTHVAGIVAAEQNNAEGVSGVCPDCQIMALRAGTASNLTLGKVIAAMDYAINNGAQVINLSLGSPIWSKAERAEIASAASDGVLVVASAGNASADNDIEFYPDVEHGAWAPSYPASYSLPNILSVAASNDRDQYAYISQCQGKIALWKCAFTSWGHDSVDVAAPGADILSTVKTGVSTGTYPGYEFFDGTSMASPLVAGIAGLVLSEHPSYTPLDVKNAIMNSVDHPSSLKMLTEWAKAIGLPKTPIAGHFTRTQGRVNALAALTAATTDATPASDGNIDGARPIDVRKTGTVAWPSDDNDVYKRRLVRGHRYAVTIDGPRGRDFDLWVWQPGTKDIFQFTSGCFRRHGTCPAFAAASTGGTADERAVFKATKTGTYYIQVASWYSRGRYVLRVKKA
jgi:subtilisin family serine protease